MLAVQNPYQEIPSINQSINQLINQSIYQFISPSNIQSINQSNKQKANVMQETGVGKTHLPIMSSYQILVVESVYFPEIQLEPVGWFGVNHTINKVETHVVIFHGDLFCLCCIWDL